LEYFASGSPALPGNPVMPNLLPPLLGGFKPVLYELAMHVDVRELLRQFAPEVAGLTGIAMSLVFKLLKSLPPG